MILNKSTSNGIVKHKSWQQFWFYHIQKYSNTIMQKYNLRQEILDSTQSPYDIMMIVL